MGWAMCGWDMATRAAAMAFVGVAIAGCAAPAGREAAQIGAQGNPSATAKSGLLGVILTVRSVSAGTSLPAGQSAPPGSMEYVVRTDDGATLAVVQAADPVLRPGVAVAVGRGERATLAAR